jgi:hypothetical protein
MTDDRDITERLEDTAYDGAFAMRREAAKLIRQLRHYVDRLEDDLREADLETERLRKHVALQQLDIVTLGQEVGRLREVLEKIEKQGPLLLGVGAVHTRAAAADFVFDLLRWKRGLQVVLRQTASTVLQDAWLAAVKPARLKPTGQALVGVARVTRLSGSVALALSSAALPAATRRKLVLATALSRTRKAASQRIGAGCAPNRTYECMRTRCLHPRRPYIECRVVQSRPSPRGPTCRQRPGSQQEDEPFPSAASGAPFPIARCETRRCRRPHR